MLRKHLASAASGILLAGGLGLGLASGTPVAAATRPANSATGLPAVTTATTAVRASTFNGTCYVWTDGNTFGTDCPNGGGVYYQAEAACKNGKTAKGSLTNSGWSYAYCSTYGSTIAVATTAIAPLPFPFARRAVDRQVRAIRGSLAASHIHQGQQVNPIKATLASTSSNGLCSVWSDGSTLGAACAWDSPLILPAYSAVAACRAGYLGTTKIETGPTVYAGWSYAYCSKLGLPSVGGGIVFDR